MISTRPRLLVALIGLLAVVGCAPSAPASPPPTGTSAAGSGAAKGSASPSSTTGPRPLLVATDVVPDDLVVELSAERPYMADGTYFPWDPLAAGYPLGSFSPARVDIEEAEGAEVGFTRPVDGATNLEYLSTADRAAAEATLLEVLNR